MGVNPRFKGKYNERIVVQQMKELGFNAGRVPFSGAGREKGDVRVEIPGSRFGDGDFEARFWYLEVKSRATEFKTVYILVEHLISEGQVLAIHTSKSKCYVSTDFMRLKPDIAIESIVTDHLYTVNGASKFDPGYRVFTFKKWLETCHLLVIRANKKPALFIRYEAPHTTDNKDIGT